MVEALRALLRAALKNPLNQRFQLLCEHTLPLQSPLLVYQQLMGEPRSRVNACNTVEWQESVSSAAAPLLTLTCSAPLRPTRDESQRGCLLDLVQRETLYKLLPLPHAGGMADVLLAAKAAVKDVPGCSRAMGSVCSLAGRLLRVSKTLIWSGGSWVHVQGSCLHNNDWPGGLLRMSKFFMERWF